MSDPVRRTVTERLLQRYATDGDPGTHSAIDWLFRTRWQLQAQLDSLDESWRGKAVSAGRNWFVNSEGMTMADVAVGKPFEFEIGSPEDEDGRESDERIHAVRLDHSYAIATREVNQGSLSDFAASSPLAGRSAKASTQQTCELCPIVGVDWLAAAEYCNWLARENLRPYYVLQGDVISVPDPLGLGYRLPSELEWEYACRSGTRSSRPHGASPAFLDGYAWFLLNANKRTHRVGTRKPNDLGLFDMLGNAFEWTGDRYTRDIALAGPGSTTRGAKPGPVSKEVEVALRGGISVVRRLPYGPHIASTAHQPTRSRRTVSAMYGPCHVLARTRPRTDTRAQTPGAAAQLSCACFQVRYRAFT